MGTQSARLWYGGKDHKEIYFNGQWHDEIHKTQRGPRLFPPVLIWKKMPTLREFSIFFKTYPFRAGRAQPDNKLCDEYGARLRYNTGAVITKCGAHYGGTSKEGFDYVWPKGDCHYVSLACVGEGISWVYIDGYLSYEGNDCYSSTDTKEIEQHHLSKDADGVWSLFATCYDVRLNFCDMDENSVHIYDKSMAIGKDTKLFYDVDEMKHWLKS